MRKFDYSFLDNGLLPANLVSISSNIYSLKALTNIKKDEFIPVFSELEKIAQVQSIKSSNAIEGIVTTDDRIAAIINENSAPLNHNEAEIAGYRDALKRIHLDYKYLDFNQDDILGLHRIMMSYLGNNYGEQYKTEDNVILEIDAEGLRHIRFRPTYAKDTPKAMEQLELAYYEAKQNSNINKLLLIPCVILDFLCIHPFNDGNGRISRLLSLLLLYKNGFDVGKYISFEEQININKSYYYDALAQSSKEWERGVNSYFPFIDNFLYTLYRCYDELNKRFDVLNNKKINKKNRIEAAVLNSLSPLSKREICDILPDVSPTTVEAILGSMLKAGLIIKIGSGRTTRYKKNNLLWSILLYNEKNKKRNTVS